MILGTSGALIERCERIGVASVCEEGEREDSIGVGELWVENVPGKI